MTLSTHSALVAARANRIPLAVDSTAEYRRTSRIAGAVRACSRVAPPWSAYYRLELSAGVARLVLIDFEDGDPPGEIVVSAEVFEALRGL